MSDSTFMFKKMGKSYFLLSTYEAVKRKDLCIRVNLNSYPY